MLSGFELYRRWVPLKRDKAKQQQTELWSNTTMLQVILYLLCCD